SFGDIFRSNAQKVGLVPVVLPQGEVRRLMDACAGGADLTVDLESQQVTDPAGRVVAFELDPFAREGILQGLHAVALTPRRDGEIDAYEQATPARVDTLALQA